jgi:hypothetical protein
MLPHNKMPEDFPAFYYVAITHYKSIRVKHA